MDDDSGLGDNLQHAKDSYANAQDVIKFIDSKSAVLTGILVITTGIPFAVLQIPLSSEKVSFSTLWTWFSACGKWSQVAACISILLLVAGVACGCMSLLSSTNGLRARRPRKSGTRERGLFLELLCFLVGRDERKGKADTQLTALFPQYSVNRSGEAKKLFQKLGKGKFTKEEILGEFAIQLESVGNVLEAKITANKNAFRWFELQILSYLGSAVIAGILSALSFLPIQWASPAGNPASVTPAIKQAAKPAPAGQKPTSP